MHCYVTLVSNLDDRFTHPVKASRHASYEKSESRNELKKWHGVQNVANWLTFGNSTCRPIGYRCQICFVCLLLNVPATGSCISGTNLLRQFYVLPHWERSCRSYVLPHPVIVYWHRTDQSQRGVPIFKSLVWLDPEKIPAQAGFEPGIFRSRGGRLTTRSTRGSVRYVRSTFRTITKGGWGGMEDENRNSQKSTEI